MAERDCTLSQKRLKELFEYDSTSGALFWKARADSMFRSPRSAKAWNARFAGHMAGRVAVRGHRVVGVFGKFYYAHRLIWALVHGYWPDDEIDHINGNRDDNRISNLRPATCSQNHWNSKRQKNNTSGVKGVNWSERDQKWQARLRVFGKRISVGHFDSITAAEAAIKKAREALHGDFHRHA